MFTAAKEVQKRMSKKKDKDGKMKGEEMRKAVMEEQTSIYICFFLLKYCTMLVPK